MIFLSILISVFLYSGSVFAQSAPIEGFEWLNSVIIFLQGIPSIGEYLAIFFQVMAVLSTGLTALAVFLETLLSVPEIIARISNSDAIAAKIKSFKEKILPWIKYFSMFNVQKKK